MPIYTATVVETGVSVTDYSLPVLSSDERIDGETIFCFDYGNTDCWPSQANAADNSTPFNLVPGGNAGKVVGYLGGNVLFSAGAFNTNIAAGSIQFGATADCDFAAMGNVPFLFCVTIKTVASNSYQTYGSNGVISIRAGANQNPRISFTGGGLAGKSASGFDLPAIGVKTHWAISVVPNATAGTTVVSAYANGVLVNQTTLAGATFGTPAVPFQFGGADSGYSPMNGLLYRAWMKRLDRIADASTAAAIQRDVLADYALMVP